MSVIYILISGSSNLEKNTNKCKLWLWWTFKAVTFLAYFNWCVISCDIVVAGCFGWDCKRLYVGLYLDLWEIPYVKINNVDNTRYCQK